VEGLDLRRFNGGGASKSVMLVIVTSFWLKQTHHDYSFSVSSVRKQSKEAARFFRREMREKRLEKSLAISARLFS